MEPCSNFIEDFLLHLKNSSDDGFSYIIFHNSRDKDLVDNIRALDSANLVEHEENHSHDSFYGKVFITQGGLDLLKTTLK